MEKEEVLGDIRAYREILAPGGLLCGHDYEPGWPGVVEAVNEAIPLEKICKLVNGSIWFQG